MAKTLTQGTKKTRSKVSRQAQKSMMTRDTILDATLKCFIEIGYSATTTAKISERAGTSRGAMLHHFPSKAGLIQATIEYLQDKLLDTYIRNIAKIPSSLPVDERNRCGLNGYWEYLNSELFTAYHELCVAGRTDSELGHILQATITHFDKCWFEANQKLFPEWSERGNLYELAMDITQFLMEGMAVSQIVRMEEKRIKRVLAYLGDRLEEIFHEGDQDVAIHRHAKKKPLT